MEGNEEQFGQLSMHKNVDLNLESRVMTSIDVMFRMSIVNLLNSTQTSGALVLNMTLIARLLKGIKTQLSIYYIKYSLPMLNHMWNRCTLTVSSELNIIYSSL